METNPSIAVLALPVLAPAECDAILAALAARRWFPGQVYDPRSTGAAVVAETRRCTLSPDIDKVLVERLALEARRVNVNVHGYELDGLAADDPVLAMRYEVGDHFDWHIDNALTGRPSETRKLAFSVQLSAPEAYDGGDLEVALLLHGRSDADLRAQRAAFRERGTMVVFPAFHLHRVAPVTRGVRVALVGWLHGPAFL